MSENKNSTNIDFESKKRVCSFETDNKKKKLKSLKDQISTKNLNATVHSKLPKLLLIEKINQCSFGLSLEDTLLEISDLKEMKTKTNTGENIPLTEFFIQLKDFKKSRSQKAQRILLKALVANKNTSANQFCLILEDLLFVSLNACQDIGRGFILPEQMLQKGRILLTKQNPEIAELLELIEELKLKPFVDMTKIQNSKIDLGEYSKFQKKWQKWISNHEAVNRYLDPPLIFIQPVAQIALGGLAKTLDALPPLLSGVAPTQLIDPNGGNWANTYSCGSPEEARSIGIALRTHYADSAGNGGPGSEIRIVTLSTTAGGVRHW